MDEKKRNRNKRKAQAKKQKKQQGPAQKSGQGKKGKGIASHLRKIREEEQALQRQREQEELEAKLKQEEEEARRKQEQQLRKLAQELARKERAQKKKRDKQLGLLKTPAQLQAQKRLNQQREQLIASGQVKIGQQTKLQGLISGRKKKKLLIQQPVVEEQPQIQQQVPPKSSESELQNWEDILDQEDLEIKQDPNAIKPKQIQHDDQEPTPSIPVKPTFQARPRPPITKANLQETKYKSPIVCILGHVDTGKTKLLDKIRHTNVQVGEAGGITQQIGATMFPEDAIKVLTDKLPNLDINIQVPGLLIIDTPGHQSFSNLRSRGSSLCNIGILVVDIMHGLENQTLQSLEMLKMRRIPFVIALNKIDRMYDWKPMKEEAFLTSFQNQPEHSQNQFRTRANNIIVNFAEQGLNVALYYQNPDPHQYVNLIPTSAISGQGIPDLLGMLVDISQRRLAHHLLFSPVLQATVVEIKIIQGLGTTIDVILANGFLRENDTIVLSGLQGPITTHIRALLTPQPLREMRVRGEYIHHKELPGSIGVKISAPNLESAIAGSPLFVAQSQQEVQELEQEIREDMASIFRYIDKQGKGVYVQASTMGSLQALLEFLKNSEIPVSGINIGPVYKKDVLRAQNQLEKGGKEEFATILAFDVKVNPEAQEYADNNGVKIFTADIIYHLFDSFTQHVKMVRDRNKNDDKKGKSAVFPCILKIIEVIRSRDPIILGVEVLGGILKVGTPLCVPQKNNLQIGKVGSIQFDHKPLNEQRASTQHIAVKINPKNSEQGSLMVGRHFEQTNQLASWITRNSIDALKNYFMEDMTREDWKIVNVLKKQFGVI